MFLECCDQGVANFVVRDCPFFLIVHDAVLLFLARDHDFDGVHQVFLADGTASRLNGRNGTFVNNVGKIRSDRTAGCQRNGVQIDGVIHAHILGVYLQDGHTALQIRLVDDNPAVKTARAQQRLVQNLRAVRGRQNEETL